MLVYGVATLLSVLFALLWQQARRRARGRVHLAALALLSLLPLLLVSALRWDTGTDTWHTYTPEYLALRWKLTGVLPENGMALLRQYYQRPHPELDISGIADKEILQYFADASSHTSPLFRLLERGLIALGAGPQWLYALTAAFTLGVIWRVIFTQSENAPLAVFLFVATSNYFLSLNIVSQYMAVALCLLACAPAQQRRPLPFAALVALAAGFHASALVFLPVYFLPRLRVKPLWCALGAAGCLLLAPLCVPALQWLIARATPQYARYFNWEGEFEWIFFGLGLLVLALGAYCYDKAQDKPYFRLWYYMNVLGLLALCFSGVLPLMKRVNYYFAAPHFLLLPQLIQCEKRPRLRRALYCGVILFFIAETLVAVALLGKNGVLPYRAFRQP